MALWISSPDATQQLDTWDWAKEKKISEKSELELKKDIDAKSEQKEKAEEAANKIKSKLDEIKKDPSKISELVQLILSLDSSLVAMLPPELQAIIRAVEQHRSNLKLLFGQLLEILQNDFPQIYDALVSQWITSASDILAVLSKAKNIPSTVSQSVQAIQFAQQQIQLASANLQNELKSAIAQEQIISSVTNFCMQEELSIAEHQQALDQKLALKEEIAADNTKEALESDASTEITDSLASLAWDIWANPERAKNSLASNKDNPTIKNNWPDWFTSHESFAPSIDAAISRFRSRIEQSNDPSKLWERNIPTMRKELHYAASVVSQDVAVWDRSEWWAMWVVDAHARTSELITDFIIQSWGLIGRGLTAMRSLDV